MALLISSKRPALLAMNFLFEDPFTHWLQQEGKTVEIYQPGAFLGAPPLGRLLLIGQSRFVYRINEDKADTLIIVLFERTAERQGLRSPFFDFIRFVNLIKKANVGIQHIQGHVEAVSWRPEDSLQNERIAAFYKKHMTANHLFTENDIEWVSGNLKSYESPR